jgi:hypothetical protein
LVTLALWLLLSADPPEPVSNPDAGGTRTAVFNALLDASGIQ